MQVYLNDRGERIDKISKLMVEINSVAQTTYIKTNEQGETVNGIVENVENAKEEVRKGNDELVEAV